MWTNVNDALYRFTVDDLKILVKQLPNPKGSGSRKADLVDHICLQLLRQTRTVYASLDSVQQLAVADTLYYATTGYDAIKFRAKYQCLPAWYLDNGKSRYWRDKSLLYLFLYPAKEDLGAVIPLDLQACLKQFVVKPELPQLTTQDSLPEEEGLTVCLNEQNALRELRTMLRSIEQEKIQVSEKTLMPGKATLNKLIAKLEDGDFYPWKPKQDSWDQEIKPMKAFAWPMLLQAAGLAKCVNKQLLLMKAGEKALASNPAEVIKKIWDKWLKTKLLDEFSRIEAIKGQNSKGRCMTAVAGRREQIKYALMQCPVEQWVSLDDFSRDMQVNDYVFHVVHDLWKLYICSGDYGRLGYDHVVEWETLQQRYIAVLLFEYAATLGLIDVAYVHPEGARSDFRSLWGADDLDFLSQYDGLCYFRVTALGAYVFGKAAHYQPAEISSNITLSVMPSLQIKITQGQLNPQESDLLENWAEPLASDSWKLNREKSITAIEKGFDIAELHRFLSKHDDQLLPETVEAFIKQCQQNGAALKQAGSALIIECRDAKTAKLIAGHKETNKLCLLAGSKTLVVKNTQLEKFHQKVRLLGFGMKN